MTPEIIVPNDSIAIIIRREEAIVFLPGMDASDLDPEDGKPIWVSIDKNAQYLFQVIKRMEAIGQNSSDIGLDMRCAIASLISSVVAAIVSESQTKGS